MFLLVGESSTFYLAKDGKYMIGRHVGDIIIGNSTVSRKHAEIIIENNEAFLQDCNSKYFTKLNGDILIANEKIGLEDGAEIIFGEVKFSVKVGEKFITCSTGVKDNEGELRSVIEELGGEYLKDWNDTCTHLTTSEIMVTLKVLHAIMDNKQIVTPNFWKTYLKNIKDNKLPPDPSEFYPPLGESMIHSKYLDNNPNRKTIFHNKTFTFWKKKRHSSMKDIISKAGGKSALIPLSNKNKSELLKLMENSIVMDPEDPNIEERYSVVLEAYKEKGRRIIPIQEIVLAILQCSCEENCNPYFNRAQTVFTRERVKPDPSRIVIGETECLQFDSEKEPEAKVIPSSFDLVNYTNTQNERNITQNEGNITQNKRNITLNESLVSLEEKNNEVTQKIVIAKKIKLDPEVVDVDAPTKRKAALLFKRPAQEPLASPAKKAKEDEECLRFNPFHVMKSRISEGPSTSKEKNDLDLTNNPFGQIQLRKDLKKEIETEDVLIVNDADSNSNNESSKKRKIEDRLDSDISGKRTKIICKKNRKFVKVASIDFSILNHTVSSGSWVDKSIKKEIKQTPSKLDKEEQKWCERFNNSVVIVSKDLWRKDKENTSNLSIIPTNSNVKNFKKFRKAAVPKTDHIIKCSKIIFGKSNLGIDYQHSDDEDNRNM